MRFPRPCKEQYGTVKKTRCKFSGSNCMHDSTEMLQLTKCREADSGSPWLGRGCCPWASVLGGVRKGGREGRREGGRKGWREKRDAPGERWRTGWGGGVKAATAGRYSRVQSSVVQWGGRVTRSRTASVRSKYTKRVHKTQNKSRIRHCLDMSRRALIIIKKIENCGHVYFPVAANICVQSNSVHGAVYCGFPFTVPLCQVSFPLCTVYIHCGYARETKVWQNNILIYDFKFMSCIRL